jgi:hypothetical protein
MRGVLSTPLVHSVHNVQNVHCGPRRSHHTDTGTMSGAGRVVSKHLFHQLGPLTGEYDEEVAADLAARGPLLGPMMAKLGAAAAVGPRACRG